LCPEQLPSCLRNDNPIGFSQTLHSGSQIGHLPHDGALSGGTTTNKISDNGNSRCDADAHLRLDRTDSSRGDSLDNRNPGANRVLCVILLSARIPEVRHYSVAQILCDEASIRRDHLGAGALVFSNDASQIFRVNRARECRRTHEVAEQYGEMTAFGFIRRQARK
jgi:hypothetical protein